MRVRQHHGSYGRMFDEEDSFVSLIMIIYFLKNFYNKKVPARIRRTHCKKGAKRVYEKNVCELSLSCESSLCFVQNC